MKTINDKLIVDNLYDLPSKSVEFSINDVINAETLVCNFSILYAFLESRFTCSTLGNSTKNSFKILKSS